MRAYLNGRYIDAQDATVSVNDRGFLFGDGVYEVMRGAAGELIEPDRHVRRMQRGLDALAIAFGDDRVVGLLDVGRTLLRDNRLMSDALVYCQVTRGTAPRTHHYPPRDTPPTVLVTATPIELPSAQRDRGAAVITLPDIRWARCDIKSVNLLPNVMAKQRAVEAGADEAVFVRDGVITEGASSTVFVVLDGELRTYPLSNYILPGVTREIVLELAQELGIPVRQVPVLADELARATEVILASTYNDVMPVTRVDGRLVGAGVPGAVAQQLYAAFAERIGAVASVR